MKTLSVIARQEALLSISLAVCYMLGWYLCAYMVPSDLLWHGWPLWFLLSCVFNPLLFIVLCAVMIKRYFSVVTLENAPPAHLPQTTRSSINAQTESASSPTLTEPVFTSSATHTR